MDLCRSSVHNDSSFGAQCLLVQSHPAAGGREQEVILLICGRISTQGVYFGREIDESCYTNLQWKMGQLNCLKIDHEMDIERSIT